MKNEKKKQFRRPPTTVAAAATVYSRKRVTIIKMFGELHFLPKDDVAWALLEEGTLLAKLKMRGFGRWFDFWEGFFQHVGLHGRVNSLGWIKRLDVSLGVFSKTTQYFSNLFGTTCTSCVDLQLAFWNLQKCFVDFREIDETEKRFLCSAKRTIMVVTTRRYPSFDRL